MTSTTLCPFCKVPGTLYETLNRDRIVQSLRKFAHPDLPASIVKADYKMYRCPECTLEFAGPLLAGDDEFYGALTRLPGYYPEAREEYPIVIEEIRKRYGDQATVLDIGCGAGYFLEQLRASGVNNISGIDLTASSVEVARKKGLNVFCERIEESNRGPYDVVCSFHCLEHVEDPVGLIEHSLRQLNTNGTLFISTPYSPQAIEYGWYHPMNNPPHHTLRLNRKAYEKLAAITGCTIELINFSGMSARSQFRASFLFALFGSNPPMSKLRVAWLMLTHPMLASRIRNQIKQREWIGGRMVGPDILVVFKKLKA